jgi:hypothetical protein
VNDVKKAVDFLWGMHRPKPKRAPQTRERVRDRQATRGWGWNHEVRGIGLGFKRVQGKPDLDTPCITFYMRRKVSRQRLPAKEQIPGRLRLVTLGEEFTTDLVEMPHRLIAHAAANIQPGDEIAHQFGARGTLGLLVHQGDSQTVLAASCSHVLARSGLGAAAGDRVEHPALPPLNQDLERNRFGTLTSTFTRLNQSDTFDQDFALAEVMVPHLAALVTNGIVVAAVADSTQGFTPGLETGLQGIRSPNAKGEVFNPTWSGTISDVPFAGDVQYENLVIYSTTCDVGDSGGVVTQFGTTTALGLHIGGSSDGVGVFMPLWPLCQSLKLTPVTQ